MIEVEFNGALPRGLTQRRVTAIVRKAFKEGGGKGRAVISVATVGDKEIRTLNHEYRGKDSVTDVLSFGYTEPEGAQPSHAPEVFGDIVICLPQVKRQAKKVGKRIIEEYGLMVVHGVLHLLGYDHVTQEEEDEMFALQHDILIETDIL